MKQLTSRAKQQGLHRQIFSPGPAAIMHISTTELIGWMWEWMQPCVRRADSPDWLDVGFEKICTQEIKTDSVV